ncbi:hypothetical protein F53441_10613 [Fusarium austroafricanum]|uniref:C2H2-type domain-containing protein n=1 Tax=Fusarium austroafricanum TaxID=2364996 RepID=A0A8H4NP28_9HYPO|nr:hypothetical protein F53441_10613 [Fusarium austroafricanum]
MEIINQRSHVRALSAADGFLAGLIYLTATRATITQDAHNAGAQHNETWECLNDICTTLQDYWSRLMEAIPTLSLKDATLNSFMDPAVFLQAGVLSLRNTMTGHTLHTLEDIIALCILSRVTSCYFHNEGNSTTGDDFSRFDHWTNTLSMEHQQVFNSLMKILWPETSNPFPSVYSFQDLAEYNDSVNFNQSALIDLPLVHDDYLLNELLGSGLDDAVPDCLTQLDSQFADQTMQDNCTDSERTQATEPWTGDLPDQVDLGLQGLAIVTNLTDFLEECGDLLQILSGRGVTTRHMHSSTTSSQKRPEVEALVSSCRQRLRQNGSIQDASTSGILLVVDKFIDLGYLQTIEEVQEYILIIGKGIIPDDKAFVRLCQSAYASADTFEAAFPSERSPRAELAAGPNRKKVPCNICGEEFTRRTNMKRHIDRKHGDIKGQGMPVLTVRTGNRVAKMSRTKRLRQI